MIRSILEAGRVKKAWLILSIDLILVVFSLWLAFSLRLGEWYYPVEDQWILFFAAPTIAIPIFVRMGLYRAVIRYIGDQAMLTIVYANVLVALIWSMFPFYLPNFIDIELFSPRSTPFIFWMLLCVFIVGNRQLARWFLVRFVTYQSKSPVVIYGAGVAGAKLAQSLNSSSEVKVIGFVDDDPALHSHQISGLSVLGGGDEVNHLLTRYPQLEVLLAMPSIDRSKRLSILSKLEKAQVAVRSIPSLDDIALGRYRLTDLSEININDLLGREMVEPNKDLMNASISKKSIIVTGAGGSIGSEISRQVLIYNPTVLILLDQSEFHLYSISQELMDVINTNKLDVELVSILGTVLDRGLIGTLFRSYQVNTVFHAAAYKHVPIVEHNILAGVRNNVIGSFNIAIEAMNNKVKNFILISTDKAVRPSNVMGASKRMAEMVLQGMQIKPGNKTCFSMVRFGNVLGSSGSVIPAFKDQIAKGGPVKVTHPEIVRYFMTISEAASLVIQAAAMAKGGDLFVLDMGKPVKVDDLAKRMIRLSGSKVASGNSSGIAVVYTGLRHGEKLYEELLIGGNVKGTSHPGIMMANEKGPESDIVELIKELDSHLRNQHVKETREFLLEHVQGYQPQCGLEDTLWKKSSL